MRQALQTIVVLILSGVWAWPACAAGDPSPADGLGLSTGLRALLQAEMRELATASQAAVAAYVAGDWRAIERLSAQMRDSYVMARELTAAQKEELAATLPARFKHRDREFHARADRLRAAAADGNAEIAAFHLYRLLESCAGCHAEFAGTRFPGFAAAPAPAHHH